MKNPVLRFKKILGGCLLTLFAGYLINSTFFLHSHFIGGEWITHSHPYSEKPDSGKHTHTPAQYITFAALTSIVMLALAFVYIFGAALTAHTLRTKPRADFHFLKKPSTLSLRGPPVN